MAGGSKNTSGNLPRALQYGLDRELDQLKHILTDQVGDRLFEKVTTEKAAWEAMQIAGMSPAQRKNEGDMIHVDTFDQFWVRRYPVFTIEKSARITLEAQRDNLYDDMLKRFAEMQAISLAYTKEFTRAEIFNNAQSTATADLGPDSLSLCNSAHTTQAGPTTSNVLSPGVPLSEDGVEQATLIVDKMLTPEGLKSMYQSEYLVVPVDLQFEAARIVASKYRTSTADNDINAVMHRGRIKDYAVWKHLSSATGWFITTDAKDSLLEIGRQGVETRSGMDPYTFDIFLTAFERYRIAFAAFYGLVAGNS